MKVLNEYPTHHHKGLIMRMKKLILWDHFCQVIFVVSTIPGIILWIKGQATPLNGLIIGFNWGCALYWQLYLWQREQTDIWMKRAMLQRESEIEEMFQVAKGMVDARMKSKHIDPDRN